VILPRTLTSSLTETPCSSGGKPGIWKRIKASAPLAAASSSGRATTSAAPRPTGDDRRGDRYGEASRRRLALLALPNGSGTDDFALGLDHLTESPTVDTASLTPPTEENQCTLCFIQQIRHQRLGADLDYPEKSPTYG